MLETACVSVCFVTMTIELYRFLHEQGYGSRKTCRQLVETGCVAIDGVLQDEYRALVDPAGVTSIAIDGESWPVWHLPLYLMLHKPAGYETSHQPLHHPSVFSLLPPQFLSLKIQAVGRLDVDTTGLLLLSTDGRFVHTLTSPKKEVGKNYRVTLKHAADDSLAGHLLRGVFLKDEKQRIAADQATLVDAHTLDMVITQGKYHQVKRMIAAAGNRVERLHRLGIGALTLGNLPVGEWRLLADGELADYRQS